jgi:hypothetical protein
MKNNIFSIFLILFFQILIVSCKTDIPPIQDEGLLKISYIESDSLIVNPERGFYSEQDFNASNLNNVLNASSLKVQRSIGRTLILTLYYLDQFRDKPISNEFLSLIETNMKALREGGCKCILRFAYSSSENSKPWDAPQNIVLQHIQQITPYLIDYSDVISVMQAGFVGVWGEWYYTSNFIMSPYTQTDYAPRRAVLDALLLSLPKDRMICVRTPEFKLKCFNITYADTLTQATAYQKTDLARIACHNDCFLADGSDMGTLVSAKHMDFWKQESKYTAMGGETCQPSSYSECSNALLKMQEYHWSYLNSGYNGSVINAWRTNGCIDEINKKLGYRFVLTQGKFTEKPTVGNDFVVKLTIKNVGFAAPFNPRNVELIFASKTDSTNKYTVKLDCDPRKWFAGAEYNIDAKYSLPIEMKGKEYDVFLNLPDPMITLSNRPEFSIRLANKNIWNKSTGLNKLLTIAVN